jgi:hypothetical protein
MRERHRPQWPKSKSVILVLSPRLLLDKSDSSISEDEEEIEDRLDSKFFIYYIPSSMMPQQMNRYFGRDDDKHASFSHDALVLK